ncbi:MAG: hypothetical protein ABIQ03_09270 [Burkholderiales bacterium]
MTLWLARNCFFVHRHAPTLDAKHVKKFLPKLCASALSARSSFLIFGKGKRTVFYFIPG